MGKDVCYGPDSYGTRGQSRQRRTDSEKFRALRSLSFRAVQPDPLCKIAYVVRHAPRLAPMCNREITSSLVIQQAESLHVVRQRPIDGAQRQTRARHLVSHVVDPFLQNRLHLLLLALLLQIDLSATVAR